MVKLTGIVAALLVVLMAPGRGMDLNDVGDTVYNVTHMLPTVDVFHGKINKPHQVHDGSGKQLLVKEAKEQLVTDAVTGAATAVVGKDVVHGITNTVKIGERAAKVGYLAKKLAEKAHLHTDAGQEAPHPYDVNQYHGEDVHVPVPGPANYGGGHHSGFRQPTGGW